MILFFASAVGLFLYDIYYKIPYPYYKYKYYAIGFFIFMGFIAALFIKSTEKWLRLEVTTFKNYYKYDIPVVYKDKLEEFIRDFKKLLSKHFS